MNHLITRAELIALLKEWEDGRLSATEVHEWAEARYVPGDFEVDMRSCSALRTPSFLTNRLMNNRGSAS